MINGFLKLFPLLRTPAVMDNHGLASPMLFPSARKLVNRMFSKESAGELVSPHKSLSPHFTGNHIALDKNVCAIAFTMSLIALAARFINKRNTQHVNAINALISLIPETCKHYNISDLFVDAYADTTPIHFHARRIARICTGGYITIMREITYALLYLMTYNTLPNNNEWARMELVAREFSIKPEELLTMIRHVLLPADSAPYIILGTKRKPSEEQLKKAYHTAVKDCHPDILARRQVAPILHPILEERFRIYTDNYTILAKKSGFKK